MKDERPSKKRRKESYRILSMLTNSFDTGVELDQNRIPYQFFSADLLPLMFQYFRELLLTNPAANKVITIGASLALLTVINSCKNRQLSGEGSVMHMAVVFSIAVNQCFEGLSDASITIEHQLESKCRKVITDHVYCKASEEVLLLWEDMVPLSTTTSV